MLPWACPAGRYLMAPPRGVLPAKAVSARLRLPKRHSRLSRPRAHLTPAYAPPDREVVVAPSATTSKRRRYCIPTYALTSLGPIQSVEKDETRELGPDTGPLILSQGAEELLSGEQCERGG